MNRLLYFLFQTDINAERFGLYMLVYRVLLSTSLFYVHGLPKITNFQTEVANIPDPFGFGQYPSALLAVFANIVCPVLVVLGLFTRLAVLPILSVTLTGYFIVHSGDPAKVRDVPFMYSLAYSLIFLWGPGKYALDAWIKKRFLT